MDEGSYRRMLSASLSISHDSIKTLHPPGSVVLRKTCTYLAKKS